jgi:hypothetical protein
VRVRPCVRGRADTLGLSIRRRVRAFVARPCSPPREEQQREYPIEAASTMRRWDRRLWRRDGATRHVRTERNQGVRSPGGTRGYSGGGSQAVCNAVLEVVKGASPWYAGRYSRALKEAHTRRSNGRRDGGRRARRRGCMRACAVARAAMDRTTKSRREYSSNTPPVEPVRRELPCSAVHPSCDVVPERCTASHARTHFLGVPPTYPRVHPMSTSTPSSTPSSAPRVPSSTLR